MGISMIVTGLSAVRSARGMSEPVTKISPSKLISGDGRSGCSSVSISWAPTMGPTATSTSNTANDINTGWCISLLP